jgi:tyrosine-protein kinase Etk/Wzc
MNDSTRTQGASQNNPQGHIANNPSNSTNHNDEIDLGEYLGILLAHKWLIAAVTLIGGLIGISYALIATPIYQANALIQVEDQQASALAGLEDVAGLLEGDAAIEAEVQLLRSRLVIRKAVEQLSLNIVAEPRYFPLVGRAIARRYTSTQVGVAKPWFAQPQFAWGGEQITVDFLEVPEHMLGSPLRLLAGREGRYTLLDEDEQLLLKGEVGQLIEIDGLTLFVAKLKARPGSQFNLIHLSPVESIRRVLNNLGVSERGKKSGMLGLTLSGPDKILITTLLNKIADVYVEQNVARSSAEAELSLSFLEKQLPPLKERVDAAENAYNLYRTQHGSVDLATETQSVLAGLVNVEQALLELQQERDELRNRFKPAHPVIKALDDKITLLSDHGSELESHADQLPETQRDILRLARDVEVNTMLYTKLLNIAQELRVVKAGTVGNVRIIDHALVPEKPIKPKKSLIVVLALVLSSFFGVALVFLLNALRGGVNDPDQLEQQLGLPVYASIMHSKLQAKMIKTSKKTGEPIGVLAQLHAQEPTIESFRSLNTSLYFSLKQASNNIIMIAGASPGIGKSFTAINLAATMANSGLKVLLIDGDLRRGMLHKYTGVGRGKGLAELITENANDASNYTHSTSVDGLELIPTGKLPPNQAELLLHEAFTRQLDSLSSHYDQVIIDSPPILAVTDAAIIGRNAATTLLVVKANFHPMRELEQATKQLQQAGIDIKGIVFNDVELNSGRYGYGKYVYQYEYKSGKT